MKYLILLLLVSQSHASITAFYSSSTTHIGASKFCDYIDNKFVHVDLNEDIDLIGLSYNDVYAGTFKNSHHVQSAFIAKKFTLPISKNVILGMYGGGVYGYDLSVLGGDCYADYESQLLPLVSPTISFEINDIRVSALSMANAISVVFEYKFKG